MNPFEGPSNFIKKGKTLHTCAGMRHILVFNSYLQLPDPPSHPLPQILALPLMCFHIGTLLTLTQATAQHLSDKTITGRETLEEGQLPGDWSQDHSYPLRPLCNSA